MSTASGLVVLLNYQFTFQVRVELERTTGSSRPAMYFGAGHRGHEYIEDQKGGVGQFGRLWKVLGRTESSCPVSNRLNQADHADTIDKSSPTIQISGTLVR